MRVTDIGAQAWKKGKTARDQKVDLLRKQLKSLPISKSEASIMASEPIAVADHVIERISLAPAGKRRLPVADRVEITWVGESLN